MSLAAEGESSEHTNFSRSPRSTLVHLPPSPTPSISSASPPSSPTPSPPRVTFGLRDFARQYRFERAVGSSSAPKLGLIGRSKSQSSTRVDQVTVDDNDDMERRRDAAGGRVWRGWSPSSAVDRTEIIVCATSQPGRDTFAREVAIVGWKVVGGRSWTGSGQVGAYVVYEIEIYLRSGATISILRRYNQFVQLRDDLKDSFPHLQRTIPPLPGKNHMSKFSPKFLAERRPRLQRFLRTIMLHPEMGLGGEESVVGRWVLGRGERFVGAGVEHVVA